MVDWFNRGNSNKIQNKKRILSKISSEIKSDYLIYKHEVENFYNNSILIVKEGEEAFFMDNGVIVQTFTPGRYILSTENYPFISKLRSKIVDNNEFIFESSIYFVNKTSSFEMPWGTDKPIPILDKVYKLFLDIRCRGSYRIQVSNPQLFFGKIMGSSQNIFYAQDIKKYLRGTFLVKIKSILMRELKKYDGGYNEFQIELEELSNKMYEAISNIFEENGLRCLSFNVEAVELTQESSENLKNVYNGLTITEKQKEVDIRMKAREKEEIAYADKNVMQTLGSSWNAQQSVDIMKKAVEGENSTISNSVMDLGVGLALGQQFGNMATNIVKTNHGNLVNEKNEMDSIKERILILKEMYDMELLTKEEFEIKKKEILERL